MKTSFELLFRRAALGGGVVAAALALTSCGAVSHELPPMKAPADVHVQAQALYEQFAGTVDERNAGSLLRAHRLNAGMDACLESAGFPEWQWSLSRSFASPADALGASDWFAEPLRPVWSENEIASAPFMAAEAEMNRDDHGRSPAYEAAIDKCLASTEPVSDAEADAVSAPEGTKKLVDAWDDALAQADDELGGDDAKRGACMRSSSLSVLDETGQTYDELGPAMSYMAAKSGPAPAGPSDPRAKSPEWQRFLAQEQEVLEADFACRKDAYEQHIMDLAPLIEDFASEHAKEIEAVEAEWREITERAHSLETE
ncbi:hypothetical protein [Mumia sp. Pv 4-285]|uniref:hypothetical protein n=1 Tax=Mumia qirimensis TaxID=3234852 RepID=UPI00351D9C7E